MTQPKMYAGVSRSATDDLRGPGGLFRGREYLETAPDFFCEFDFSIVLEVKNTLCTHEDIYN